MQLERIRVVLVNTSHPGNIGAAARAMKTMGLAQLYLVDPLDYPSDKATALASGAEDILQQAQVVADLPAAVQDCVWIVGVSARLRSIRWPVYNARDIAGQVMDASGDGTVALVFGRERTGLTNAEMDLCHVLAHIPANPDYSSLNLAQAVQVLAYELRMQALGEAAQPHQARTHRLATAAEMESFYDHLHQTLFDLEFITPQRQGQVMRRLRRLFQRSRVDQNELNILRGILAAAQDKARFQENTEQDCPSGD